MSSASLAVARHHAHPDATRIAAISAAIALNLAVIMVASRPTGPAAFEAILQLSPVQLIRFIDPPPILSPPPPIEAVPVPHPPTVPAVRLKAAPVSAPVVVPTDAGRLAAPVEASLAYRSAPLRFPARALAQRMQGTVLLRVLVDETGKPVQVTVEQSSGYALLDRSAREQVLADWRFQPAMVNGQAVHAWARVPVTFALRQ